MLKQNHISRPFAIHRHIRSFQKQRRIYQLTAPLTYIGVFVSVLLVLALLYTHLNIAPFGNASRSLAAADADLQYLDFFMYLKDVFSGDNSIAYTFSKTLGGGYFAVFTYYLCSPFNLLLLFFDKTSIVAFYDITVALKLALAGVTCTYYVSQRFRGVFPTYVLAIFGIGYALSQYNLAQSYNLMWLDGVYLLPLIFLGVYRLVTKRSYLTLILAVAASLLFNWYTGIINCLFASILVFIELALFCINRHTHHHTVIVRIIVRYAASMICAFAISAIVIIPTLLELRGGRGVSDFNDIQNTWLGSIATVVSGSVIGTDSGLGLLSWFPGSLVLILSISCLVDRTVALSIRTVFAGLIAIGIMACYWQPLFWIFSLTKTADSYWYRFSYGILSSLFFIAAYYAAQKRLQHSFDSKLLLKTAVCWSLALIVADYIAPAYSRNYVYYTALLIIVCAVLLHFRCSSSSRRLRQLCAVALVLMCIVEVTIAGKQLFTTRAVAASPTSSVTAYVANAEQQIQAIRQADPESYRIYSTVNRNMTYNEPAAHNYWSITGYTSDPDNNQRQFLDALGYRINGDNFNVTEDSNLAAESLLGVKYIITDQAEPYLMPRDDLPKTTVDGSVLTVYENPFALPLSFSSQAADTQYSLPTNSQNPFENINAIYRYLTNQNISVFTPASYTVAQKDDRIIYTLDTPKQASMLYGNIPWNHYANTTINANGNKFFYAQWASRSVFSIPNSDNGSTVRVTLTTDDSSSISVGTEQFYILNIDALRQATSLLQSSASSKIDIHNGSATITHIAESQQQLTLLIPFDSNWNIQVNGAKVTPSTLDNCLMIVPLETGKNTITMQYKIPGFTVSSIITIVGLASLAIYYRIRFWRNRHHTASSAR